MALTIGTGFVVDDAIVMIENIVRHMENGEGALNAALRGAREIGFTVISLTLSLVAVFIPLLFMTGLVGRMFREFALTLTIAVVASAIVSLTLTPMMCARLLRHSGSTETGLATRFRAFTTRFHELTEQTVEAYRRSLEWVLRRQRETLIVTMVTLVATILLYIIIPKGFLPLQDTGLITAVTEAGTDVSFAEMQRRQRVVEDAIRSDPDVTGVVSVIGVSPINATPNAGRLAITLKPRDDRKAHVDEIVARLKQTVANVPGMTVYFQRRRTSRFRHAQAVRSIDTRSCPPTATKWLSGPTSSFAVCVAIRRSRRSRPRRRRAARACRSTWIANRRAGWAFPCRA